MGFFDALGSAVSSAVSAVSSAVSSVSSAASSAVSSAVSSVSSAASSVSSAASSAVSSAVSSVSSAVSSAGSFYDNTRNAGSNVTNTIAEYAKGNTSYKAEGSNWSYDESTRQLNIKPTPTPSVFDTIGNVLSGASNAVGGVLSGASDVAGGVLSNISINPSYLPLLGKASVITAAANTINKNLPSVSVNNSMAVSTDSANHSGKSYDSVNDTPTTQQTAPEKPLFVPVYLANSVNGGKQSQTWLNTETGVQVAFGAGEDIRNLYTADGTLKDSNYYLAEAEAKRIAGGGGYHDGDFVTAEEVDILRRLGKFDESKFSQDAKYSHYLSNPSDFGKFLASGGADTVLNSAHASTPGYVYDNLASIKHDGGVSKTVHISNGTPFEAVRDYDENTGTLTYYGVTESLPLNTAHDLPTEYKTKTPETTVSNITIEGVNPTAATNTQGDKNVLDALYFDGRNAAYNNGDVLATAGYLAIDCVLPTDGINVINKLATGRGGELTAEDYIWAGLDALCVAAIPFTAGGSLAVRAGVKGVAKASKTAAKVTKSVGYGGQVGLTATYAGEGLYNGIVENRGR